MMVQILLPFEVFETSSFPAMLAALLFAFSSYVSDINPLRTRNSQHHPSSTRSSSRRRRTRMRKIILLTPVVMINATDVLAP